MADQQAKIAAVKRALEEVGIKVEEGLQNDRN